MLELSAVNLRRQEQLAGTAAASKEQLDAARASYERDRARVDELDAALEVARLAGREDELGRGRGRGRGGAGGARHGRVAARRAPGRRRRPRRRSPTPSTGRASMSAPARRWSSCCRPPTSSCASSCPSRCWAALQIGDTVELRLRRLPGRPDRADQLHRARGRVHAAGDLQPREPREARVPGRGRARSGEPAAASGPAGRRPAERAMTERAGGGDRRSGAEQELRRPARGRRLLAAGARGRDLRLPRPQRQRQDHHHPDAVRAAHAGRRPRHLPRPRHPARGRGDQAPGRLHDPALQPVRGPERAREPRLRRADLSGAGAPPGGRAGARAARARRARPPARGRALGRLEAAPGARRLHPARAEAAAARRADRRASIPRPGASSGSRSTRSPPPASPCWSAPTTWTRPSAATGSPISPTAAC